MASIYKPLELLLFSGNPSQNLKEFDKQLIWFIEGTESLEKSNMTKIGIMLYGRKEAHEVYKTLLWVANSDDTKFEKVIEVF